MEPLLEIPLTGGRITPGVVRVGDTVRRPVGAHSPFVHRLLTHLENAGCDAAPRLLGTDSRGREILGFQQGRTRTEFRSRDWSPAQITAAARLLRRLHDATAGLPLAGGEETVCHNDFSPLNVTFVAELPAHASDFDQAAPGPRVEAERTFHTHAGRPTPPGSWLAHEITWLHIHTEPIDRAVAAGR